MDTKYIVKKTGKMTAQTGSSNAVGIAIYYILKRVGIEMGADEVMIYMVAVNIVGNAIIKFIEKFSKRESKL